MKPFLLILAYVLLALGLVSMFSPLPGATLLIAAGCALLICTSERAANFIRKTRGKYTWINGFMTWIENKLGEKLSGPMRMTRPVSCLLYTSDAADE